MPKEFTYAEAGVDRELRAKSKEGLKEFEETYVHSIYGPILKLPFGNLTPVNRRGRYHDHVIEGIGTKVLPAQIADKYDTIGIDGVAMAVNDVIRSGARPLTIADNIDAQKSDPYLVNEWEKGLIDGAHKAEVAIVSGEIADVAVLIRGIKEDRGFHIVCSCVGYVNRENIIFGSNLVPGDVIIGLRSSGIHSNGISLAREVLFKEWRGYYDDPFVKLKELEKELVLEVLEPTRIYVKEIMRANKEYHLKAAVHVTGDAHLKYEKLMPNVRVGFKKLKKYNPKIGFYFNNLRPQPIFSVIQDTAKKLYRYIRNLEMLKTFNFGDGFDVIVEREKEDDVLDLFEKMGVEAWRVGIVNDSGEITAKYKGRKYKLK